MPVSALRVLDTERGRHSASAVVAAGTTYTASIPLKRSDFDYGSLVLYVKQSATYALHRRCTSYVYFTKAVSDAVAKSTEIEVQLLRGYTGPAYDMADWKHRGYFYSDGSKLSDAYFSSVSSGSLRIESCRINGSLLDIAFKNVHPSLSATLAVEIEWRCVRAVYS